MLATIQTKHTERTFSIHILKCNNRQLISTLPMMKTEPIYLYPHEVLTITIPTKSAIFTYDVRVMGIQQYHGTTVCSFVILSESKQPNHRRTPRTPTDLPAVCLTSNDADMTLATILDISKQGLKIETNNSLVRKTFRIVFEQNTKKETRRVKIAWSKKTDYGYQYGLHIVL